MRRTSTERGCFQVKPRIARSLTGEMLRYTSSLHAQSDEWDDGRQLFSEHDTEHGEWSVTVSRVEEHVNAVEIINSSFEVPCVGNLAVYSRHQAL